LSSLLALALELEEDDELHSFSSFIIEKKTKKKDDDE